MSKCRFTLGAGVGAFALVLAQASLAQVCDTTPQGGDQTNNDDCTQAGTLGYVDPNGGCNFGGEPQQDLGTFSAGQNFAVDGTFGTFIPSGATTYTSRDLDWYTFTLSNNAKVSFDLQALDQFSVGLAATQLFIGAGNTCPADFFYAFQVNGCQHTVTDVYLTAGTYRVVVATPFETDATLPVFACPSTYRLAITTVPGQFAVCNTSTDSCIELHAAGGCNDFGCCNVVCGFNPDCCNVAWDQACIDLAVSECGYFIYSCSIVGGAPANDCAVNATTVEIGDCLVADNTSATTDGNNGIGSACASDIGNDLWYLVQAPADGQLGVNYCNANYDSIIMLYAIGNSPAFDPALLQEYQIGCADDTCGTVGGPSQVTLIDAVGGEWYLVRVGGFIDPQTQVPSTGSGDVCFEFQSVIFDTGAQKFAFNSCSSANVNLGLSSGNLGGANTQRWVALPFTVPAAASGYTQWRVNQVIGKGFIADAVNFPVPNLGIKFWKRNAGSPAPVAADLVATYIVPAPTPYDDPNDSAATAAFAVDLPVPLDLNPGDYYITIYGDNNGGLSNWAWFLYAPNGVNLTNGSGAPKGYRSTAFPAPGFTDYLGVTSGCGTFNLTVQAGDDQGSVYTNAVTILGEPTGQVTNPCPGDANNDHIVNGADIGVVIGNWNTAGPTGDLNNDGIVNGADLGIVIGNWGCTW